MTLRINDLSPNFTAESTAGKLTLHDWIGDNYAIFFHIQKTLRRYAPQSLVRLQDWLPNLPNEIPRLWASRLIV